MLPTRFAGVGSLPPIPVPETWDQLADLAAALEGADLDMDGVPDYGEQCAWVHAATLPQGNGNGSLGQRSSPHHRLPLQAATGPPLPHSPSVAP
jgi:hypothetical protein